MLQTERTIKHHEVLWTLPVGLFPAQTQADLIPWSTQSAEPTPAPSAERLRIHRYGTMRFESTNKVH